MWPLDDSPWVLPSRSGWQSPCPSGRAVPVAGKRLVHAAMTTATFSFPGLVETFRGNLASFAREGLLHDQGGAHLIISKPPLETDRTVPAPSLPNARLSTGDSRQKYWSHVVPVSSRVFSPSGYAAVGNRYRTHRGDPRGMAVNVYFNSGDDGASIGFGYRGSPCRIGLGFDATLDSHLYAIDWRPGRIVWLVDGRVVHERAGWDPTPLSHLPMRLYANLWASRSEELAGRINEDVLPTTTFRNISARC